MRPAASAPVPTVELAASAYPSWLSCVIDRAATLLQVHHASRAPVCFTWCENGDEWPFLAVLEWTREDFPNGPRVVVLNAFSGDFICASLPGQPTALDASRVCWDNSFAADDSDPGALRRFRDVAIRGARGRR